MNQAKFSFKEFVDIYRENLGMEDAEKLIRKAIQKAELSIQDEFNREEAMKICRALKQYSGFIGIVGGILNSRFMIR